MDNKEIIVCPKCARQLYVPPDRKMLEVTCLSCRVVWELPQLAESVKEGRDKGLASGTESIQEGSPKSSEATQEKPKTLTFECSTCNHPICIPNEKESSNRRTVVILPMESASHGVPIQGQSLICAKCGASHSVLSSDQGQRVLQQSGLGGLLESIFNPSQDNSEPKETIVSCPVCAMTVRINIVEGIIQVSCPSCKTQWDWPGKKEDYTLPCPACQHPTFCPPNSKKRQPVICSKCGMSVLDYTDKAPGIEPIFILPRSQGNILSAFLSDLKIIGWSVLFLSITAMAFVGYSIVRLTSGYLLTVPSGLWILIFLVLLSSGTVGVMVFLAGEWLFEKKLGITFRRKPPS